MAQQSPLAAAFETGALSFLVGAGVSIDAPSCIPAAYPIIGEMCRWLAAGDESLARELIEQCKPGRAFCPFDFLRFEAVLEAVSRQIPQILRLLSLLEANGTPNLTHLFLVRAAARGARILTTNFDTRLEMAADWTESSAPLFILSPRRKSPPADARIIKLHGSFPDYQRGGNHLPRGALAQIGAIGLTFEHLPGFADWFEADSRGRTLVVMGYSASDSFDVVPLIEEHWAGDRVLWFDYAPGMSKVQATEVAEGDGCIVPVKPSVDFVGMTLSRLKFLRPDCQVKRVQGSGLSPFLSWAFGKPYRDLEKTTQAALSKLDTDGFKEKNLEALRLALDSLEVDPEGRRAIAHRLLREDAFGEHLTSPSGSEAEAPEPEADDDAYRTIVSLHKSSGDLAAAEALYGRLLEEAGGDLLARPDLAYAQAYILLEQGRIADGFSLMERSFLAGIEGGISGATADTLLMYADGEFSMCLDIGDRSGMKRAQRKLRSVARKSGAIWGLVLWHYCKAREIEAALREENAKWRYKQILEDGERHSNQACYFFMRTGQLRLYIGAMRLHAYFLDLLGQRRQARVLVQRTLAWIPEDVAEDRIVCLFNCISSAADARDLPEAHRLFQQLKDQPASDLPDYEIFVAMASAEIAMAEGRLDAAGLLLTEAEERARLLIVDHWSHADNIRAARNKLMGVQRALQNNFCECHT